jgi:hypothetical protein
VAITGRLAVLTTRLRGRRGYGLLACTAQGDP